MKKIIALFVLMLGVSFTASAQKKSTDKPAATATADSQEAAIQKAAINDTRLLNDYVTLSNQQEQAFRELFAHKHRVLIENKDLSNERKQILAETIEAKINATLTADQLTKLSQNQKLAKQLSGKK